MEKHLPKLDRQRNRPVFGKNSKSWERETRDDVHPLRQHREDAKCFETVPLRVRDISEALCR